MAYELQMPQLAQSVVEGELSRWLVAEGDVVEPEQLIAEITSDKVDVELPAPVGGVVLKILVPQGSTVPVGTPLAYIGERGETWNAKTATSSATFSSLTSSILGIDEDKTAAATPAAMPTPQPKGPARASPAVRTLAKGLGIDLDSIHGTGAGGRITEQDVTDAASARQSASPEAAQPIEYVPFSGRRKQIARHLVQCKAAVPHASCIEEFDFGQLAELRARDQKLAESRDAHLTYLAYVVCATARALGDHPLLNSTLEETEGRIAVKRYYNIGIAVDAPEGLIVPVIRNADRKGLLEVAKEIQSLSRKARSNQLSPADVQDSTFTISNVGGQAGLFSIGVINYPEAALLNLHRIQSRPVSVDNEIRVRPMAYVTLTFDHRILDGGEVVRFLNDLKQLLERPDRWARIVS